MDVFYLGPLMINAHTIIFLICLGLFFVIGSKVDRNNNVQEKSLSYEWVVLITGIIIGRGVFVFRHLEYYKSEPWSALNLFDRDFSLWGSIAGALIATLIYKFCQNISFTITTMRLGLIMGLTIAFIGSMSAYDRIRNDVYFTHNAVEQNVDISANRPRVINYWATWCPPCVKEMPRLIEAAKTYSNEVEFTFVNQFQRPHEIRAFEMRYEFEIPNLIINDGSDPDLKDFGQGLPTTLFLDQNGKVIYQHVGEISNALLNTKIEELLSEKDGS